MKYKNSRNILFINRYDNMIRELMMLKIGKIKNVKIKEIIV